MPRQDGEGRLPNKQRRLVGRAVGRPGSSSMISKKIASSKDAVHRATRIRGSTGGWMFSLQGASAYDNEMPGRSVDQTTGNPHRASYLFRATVPLPTSDCRHHTDTTPDPGEGYLNLLPRFGPAHARKFSLNL